MDIRSRKTRQTIAKCFPELLRKTPVSKITVTEICAMAKINRDTYYKHYLDIPDLQEALENEMLYQFREFLQSRAFSDNGTYRAMLIEFLSLTRQFGGSYYTLCSPNAASDLAARTFQLLPWVRKRPERIAQLRQRSKRGGDRGVYHAEQQRAGGSGCRYRKGAGIDGRQSDPGVFRYDAGMLPIVFSVRISG